MTNFTSHRTARIRELGISVILVLVMIPVLMFALAISVDVALVTISQQQMRGSVRLLSLAAIETYFDDAKGGSTPRERLDRTLERINFLAKQNSIIAPSEHAANTIVLAEDADGSEGGTLTLGNYFSALVPQAYCADDAACLATCSGGKDCNPCTVPRASSPNPPCFYALQREEVLREENPRTPSAFRVDASLYGNIFTRFAPAVFGTQAFTISSSSISTIVPRHFMFVVDVTGSTIRENYKFRTVQEQEATPREGRGTRAAFFLSRDNGTGLCSSQPSEPSAHDWHWRFLEDFNGSGYSSPLPTCTDPGAPSGIRREKFLAPNELTHFYDDYQKVSIVSSKQECADTVDFDCRPELHPDPPSDCGVNPLQAYCSAPETYRVDTFSTPQPLGTILKGLADATDELQKRMVAGDKMGVYLFDRRPIWNRIIKPTDQFDYLKNAATSKAFQQRMKFFPGREGYTDIRWALSEAVTQLSQVHEETGVQSQDAIVLISDGRANCSSCEGMSVEVLSEFDVNNNNWIEAWDREACRQCGDLAPQCNGRCWSNAEIATLDRLVSMNCLYGCQNSFIFFTKATDDAHALARDLSKSGANIPIHVIPIGREVGPHWRDVQDPTTSERRCLSDQEARARNLHVVRPGSAAVTEYWGCPNFHVCSDAYAKASAEFPFFEAVFRMYWLAMQTGGVYAPLYPEQASFCGSANAPDCAATPNSPDCCFSDQYSDHGTPWNVYWWMKDKYCRTPEQQMREHMQQIITEQSPYIIVDAN